MKIWKIVKMNQHYAGLLLRRAFIACPLPAHFQSALVLLPNANAAYFLLSPTNNLNLGQLYFFTPGCCFVMFLSIFDPLLLPLLMSFCSKVASVQEALDQPGLQST